MTLEQVAQQVASEAISEDEAFAIDPATIAAIIAIISQLIPMIRDCREANETDQQAAVRIARRAKRRTAVFLRWRLHRVIGAELGPFGNRSLVEDIGEAVLRIPDNETMLQAVFA